MSIILNILNIIGVKLLVLLDYKVVRGLKRETTCETEIIDLNYAFLILSIILILKLIMFFIYKLNFYIWDFTYFLLPFLQNNFTKIKKKPLKLQIPVEYQIISFILFLLNLFLFSLLVFVFFNVFLIEKRIDLKGIIPISEFLEFFNSDKEPPEQWYVYKIYNKVDKYAIVNKTMFDFNLVNQAFLRHINHYPFDLVPLTKYDAMTADNLEEIRVVLIYFINERLSRFLVEDYWRNYLYSFCTVSNFNKAVIFYASLTYFKII